ncbi:hypothetical protein EUX98_g7807 [Antrodiella citrinella]|uniref:Alpha/beta hydrolase fold-3 domain-containing protein n=1 Tax=Antrodiella citrinella TaxID=2447956 RepID=A0A4S4MMZ1_9APHY|nr:hypothetical protein EUX98_g7807 [Antrodiella citrinella]
MFEFRRQPLKAVYTLYFAVSIFVRLPIWVVASLLPAMRPRKAWTVSRTLFIWSIDAYVRSFYKVGFPVEPVLEGGPDVTGFVWVEPIPEDYVVGEIKTMADVNGVKPERICGYWHGKKGADGKFGQRAEPGERVLYVLHGGGYSMGSGGSKDDILSSPYTICIPRRSPDIFQRSFGLEYRLSAAAPLEPKNPFPAVVLDAVAGYRYLIEDRGFEPKNIVVFGDSAGAHLGIALIRYIILADLPNLSIPGGFMALSPSCDWGDTHNDGSPQCSVVANKNSDFVHAIISNGYTSRCLLGSLPPEELETNAWLSPSSLRLKKPEGVFKGFPPTLINAGGTEVALDDKRMMRDRMIKDCGEEIVTYLEYEDAAHDFIMFRFLEPERTQALDDIHNWLLKIFSE